MNISDTLTMKYSVRKIPGAQLAVLVDAGSLRPSEQNGQRAGRCGGLWSQQIKTSIDLLHETRDPSGFRRWELLPPEARKAEGPREARRTNKQHRNGPS
ncbi:hypothetical protein E2C01_041068 [Portunus trituberculatus]|uniref:Uncharacterized protein n=1 Tax=Portunus trituberculatus TaxID=210409 RepID=A0A5B7FPE3_PORTR|nr:hypothetical protein [Portunus trituberculatus]